MKKTCILKTSVNGWKSGLQWQIYQSGVIPEFYLPFKAFSLLNFAMTDFFFDSNIYIIKKYPSSKIGCGHTKMLSQLYLKFFKGISPEQLKQNFIR